MLENLSIDIYCNICKEKADIVVELDNNKGFVYYCPKHFKRREIDQCLNAKNVRSNIRF
jgi:hypothetical protein